MTDFGMDTKAHRVDGSLTRLWVKLQVKANLLVEPTRGPLGIDIAVRKG